MARKKTRLRYGEGTWFAVPLKKRQGYGIGVVARLDGRGAIFGYFFAPRLHKVPTIASVGELTAEDAILRYRFGDVGLVDGRWPIIGIAEGWDRRKWPLPPFIIVDDEDNTAMQTVYSDDLRRLLLYRPCSPKLAERYPEDACAGYLVLEDQLTELLRSKKSSRDRKRVKNARN